MRVVIDMQGAQTTGSRSRGIGRYTLSLTQAMVRNRGEHDIVLALSDLFPDTIEPIRAAFDGLMPQENIRVWHAPGPVCQHVAANAWRRQAAELLREAFLASLNPTVVVVSSLFEGLGDDAVTSIGRLSQTIPTAVILYDLIPLINRSPYLDNPMVATWYENKLAHLRRADLLLTISASSRQEGIDYLGFPADKAVNIATAADAHFKVQSIDAARQADLLAAYGLARPYVMYTGGIDHRKNIEGLISAYASLPAELRQKHQLSIVCSIQPHDRIRLETLASQQGLAAGELILTGYVPEEDLVALYNLCKVFVFPSWHEGFGLPALEAMSCGRAVIGARTSSLPEVIGCEEALFDPFDKASIASKLQQVLIDDVFRHRLERHGLEQSKTFSWNKSAQTAIGALDTFVAGCATFGTRQCKPPRRPRLAYVSPLPPERSGISDYSTELLPELARHYDLEVIVAQDQITTPWIQSNCPIRTVEWFRAHAAQFDRVLYHFGNSSFHQHMFALLEAVPGVVVLHDFFLSGVIAYMENTGYRPGFWTRQLYQSHGYAAVRRRFKTADLSDLIWEYPCNLNVLNNAQGIIVHSTYSCRLAQHWYGPQAGKDWTIIPHLRMPDYIDPKSRVQARTTLGLNENNFVVCSFGLLGPTKLNHRLLDVWLASPLSASEQCVLVFVGENDRTEYGKNLSKTIKRIGLAKRIRITGWAEASLFRQYLAAADLGVQLRTKSRGETSGTVLDCMNHGIATIVNAHGSMADLPDAGVWKLQDEFTDAELAEALTSLWRDATRRHDLGRRAQKHIRTQHLPRACADEYFSAIERFHRASTATIPVLTKAIARLESAPTDDAPWRYLAQALDRSITPALQQRQILVDISGLVQFDQDIGSGAQRIVRNILKEWLSHPPQGYRVEPVYVTVECKYRYARCFTQDFLGAPGMALEDEAIAYAPGDVFVGLNFQPQVVPVHRAFYQELRRHGVKVKFLVYDLLRVQMPQYFVVGAAHDFTRWLEVVAESDGALCISKAVADALIDWMKEISTIRLRHFRVDWFHLGANLDVLPSKGLPADAKTTLDRIGERKTFLMVGTLEPRKGHAQVLDAFEQLWQSGQDVSLIIVGKRGWMIDVIVARLHNHPELNRRLFWLEGISDEYLGKIYAVSTCLIATSYGDGFGLPLIESAQHKMPIIARDIPVFREVAGDHAYYFDGQTPDALARAVTAWLVLYEAKRYPRSDEIPCLTWKESACQLFTLLQEN